MPAPKGVAKPRGTSFLSKLAQAWPFATVSMFRSRRATAPVATGIASSQDGFVYVNQDGSVRELSPDERAYLSQDFAPGDGGRPYIKASYDSTDGWGSVSGFLPRREVPRQVTVEPVNPDYVPPRFDPRRQAIEDGRRAGDIVTANLDGSVTSRPDPNVPPRERFERLREIQLERQREREDLARHPDFVKK